MEFFPKSGGVIPSAVLADGTILRVHVGTHHEFMASRQKRGQKQLVKEADGLMWHEIGGMITSEPMIQLNDGTTVVIDATGGTGLFPAPTEDFWVPYTCIYTHDLSKPIKACFSAWEHCGEAHSRVRPTVPPEPQ